MSSSEEYLDSLLKSLTEGDSVTGADSSSGTSEFDMADEMQENTVSNDSSVSGEHNKAMSMNDLEAMFASMGETTEEEPIDDLVLDESLMPEETAVEEEELPEDPIDDFVLDESLMPEETAMEEEELPEDPIDDFVLDESLMPEEMAVEEEELPETTEGDFALDDLSIDDFALQEEMLPDESEESMQDDFGLEESLDDIFESSDSESDDLALSDLESDDLALSDLGLDDLGFDDVVLDDADQSEENAAVEEESSDDFVLDESGDDDEGLSALLAGMGSDEDLAEINDLLEKADQGVSDDDMLAMLGDVSGLGEGEEKEDGFNLFGIEGEPENIREITPEELEERENSKKENKKAKKERKKKEKQERKNKKKKGTEEKSTGEEDELNSLLESMDESAEKPKKQGFFSRIIDVLLEEDEDENEGPAEGEAGSEIGNLSDENKEILAELKAEDKKNAKKKDKKDKKGKNKGAEGEGEEEAKAQKPKKEKKKKKKEKETIPEDELKVPEKKLSKKKVTSVFLFCATIAACIIVLYTLLPTQMDKQEARVAFDYGQYEQVYELLYGKQLSEADDTLLQKSSIILQTKRKLESYENYRKLDMPLEALNALLEGVNRYQNLRDEAELYRISDELYDVYDQILAALANSYGISESEALDILASGDNVTYSQRLRSIIYGDVFSSGDAGSSEVKQDVLPEEEEIIDRLQDADNTGVNDEDLQAEEIDEVTQAEEESLEE